MKKQTEARPKHTIEIGTLVPETGLLGNVSLPLSLDSVIYPKMKLITIKAWYLFISVVEESTLEEYRNGICHYVFPALEFARMMNMTQLRGARVASALRPLVHYPVVLVDDDSIDAENQNLLDTNLLMKVTYNGKEKGKPIEVWVDPLINHLLFHSKQRIDFDYLDIVKLSSVASIHVFTILYRLHLQHIHVISLQEFKNRLQIGDKLERFYDFAKIYLKPVEADIRKNTSFKNFRFHYTDKSPTGKSIAVREIYFDFDAPELVADKEDVFARLSSYLDADFRKKAQYLETLTQVILTELCEKSYAVNKYQNLIMKVIHDCSENAFRLCAKKILDDAGKNTLKSKYGRILTKELKKLLQKKMTPRDMVRQEMQEAVRQQSFNDQQQWKRAYIQRAKEDLASATVDDKADLLRWNEEQISRYLKPGQKLRKMDILVAKPDKRKSSWRALVAFLADQYMHGRIRLQPKLF